METLIEAKLVNLEASMSSMWCSQQHVLRVFKKTERNSLTLKFCVTNVQLFNKKRGTMLLLRLSLRSFLWRAVLQSWLSVGLFEMLHYITILTNLVTTKQQERTGLPKAPWQNNIYLKAFLRCKCNFLLQVSHSSLLSNRINSYKWVCSSAICVCNLLSLSGVNISPEHQNVLFGG